MQHYVPNTGHQHLSAIEAYQSYGNLRPPLSVLNRVRASITNRGTPTSTARLVLADAHIDTAMAKAEGAQHQIGQARDELGEVIEDIEYLESAGHDKTFAGQSANLVTAYLRRAELSNWLKAASGSQITPDYDDLLTAAGDVVALDKYNGDARARIIEFVPVLLGARGLARGTTGWLGRLTLDREDHRCIMAEGNHTNWDVGVCQSSSPASYDQPEVRIDMKTSRNNVTAARRHRARTNIGVISASSCGFRDPVPVIWSCIQEADGFLPVEVDVPILTSDQLDAMTAKIANRFPGQIAA